MDPDSAPLAGRFTVSAEIGDLPSLAWRPAAARALLVLGHGAGAGMRHAFMEAITGRLAAAGVATFRYEFPYMARGSRRPDPPRVLTASVRAAIAAASRWAGDLPLFVGGKSMGGRMTSTALSSPPAIDGVSGLVFFGFPLHPAGKPGTTRGDHLDAVAEPMLFLQGTRDKLAELDLLRPVCQRLGDRVTLHEVAGADHGFHVLKRSGRRDEEVLDELVSVAVTWLLARLDQNRPGQPSTAGGSESRG